jgi:hypothetical protein
MRRSRLRTAVHGTVLAHVAAADTLEGKLMRFVALGVMVAFLLSGCAVAPVARDDYSLIDPKGVDMASYQQDYRECAALANQTRPEDRAVAGGLGGAAIGAAFGALLGAVICGSDCAGTGAGIGAVTGGTQGAVGGGASGVQEQQTALRRCLAGRGYRIIR